MRVQRLWKGNGYVPKQGFSDVLSVVAQAMNDSDSCLLVQMY